jgi:hypothetical protein
MGNHGQSAESDPSPLIERYKKLVDRIRKSTRRSAHNENKEKKKMSATETKKGSAATSETIAELFHEAMLRQSMG